MAGAEAVAAEPPKLKEVAMSGTMVICKRKKMGGHSRGRAIAPRARVGWREIAEKRNGEGHRVREEEERPSRRGRSRGDER